MHNPEDPFLKRFTVLYQQENLNETEALQITEEALEKAAQLQGHQQHQQAIHLLDLTWAFLSQRPNALESLAQKAKLFKVRSECHESLSDHQSAIQDLKKKLTSYRSSVNHPATLQTPCTASGSCIPK